MISVIIHNLIVSLFGVRSNKESAKTVININFFVIVSKIKRMFLIIFVNFANIAVTTVICDNS